MSPFIERLEVKGFRALTELKVDSLGRVNLITGKNNAGKSSLLEAIRILVTGGATRTLYDILDYREESVSSNDADRAWLPTDLAPFCSLFSGFPDLASSNTGFTISAQGSLPQTLSSISARIGWFVRRTDPDGHKMSLEPATPDLFGDVDGFPALTLNSPDRQRIIPFDRFQRRFPLRTEADATPGACVYLDPFSSRSTGQMGALWDAIALRDVESEIVHALQIISTDIKAVQVVGSDDRGARSRTAITRIKGLSSPVPLKSLGDGVNRLFGIILSLCNAQNGVLLIDEIENGLHYSVQPDIWRTIFRLASTLNVQVFATSHSWDCVRAFQQAASENPQQGALVRLTRREDRIIPTPFTEQELALVTRDQIEVR